MTQQSKSSRNVYEKEWKLQTKGSTDGTIRVLSCRKDRFLNRESPLDCGYGLMMTMTKKERSTLSMFDRYNKSTYIVVGSCMMWWSMKFEWLAYGDESLLCTILHVYSTALSNIFLLLLHSESMRKISTMRLCYCFIFVEYISFDVGFYLLPSHVSGCYGSWSLGHYHRRFYQTTALFLNSLSLLFLCSLGLTFFSLLVAGMLVLTFL